MGTKPPVLAAILSLFIPGLGHLYAGAWGRGVAVLVGFYVLLSFLESAGGQVVFYLYPFFLAPVAYDAWKTAEHENGLERAEVAAGAAPRTWLHWLWGALRLGWITLFLLAFGGAAFYGVFSALKKGLFLGAAIGALPAVLLVALSWLAARSTVRVLRGREFLTTRAIVNEIGGTFFVVGVCVLMFMIAYPSFSGVYRKSAEGEMKGGLATIRDAFARYRAERSENPPSLEALVESKHLSALPRLWPGRPGVPHEPGTGTVLLPDRVPTDSGKWAYAAGFPAPVFIDCTHTDTRGSAWASY